MANNYTLIYYKNVYKKKFNLITIIVDIRIIGIIKIINNKEYVIYYIAIIKLC